MRVHSAGVACGLVDGRREFPPTYGRPQGPQALTSTPAPSKKQSFYRGRTGESRRRRRAATSSSTSPDSEVPIPPEDQLNAALANDRGEHGVRSRADVRALRVRDGAPMFVYAREAVRGFGAGPGTSVLRKRPCFFQPVESNHVRASHTGSGE